MEKNFGSSSLPKIPDPTLNPTEDEEETEATSQETHSIKGSTIPLIDPTAAASTTLQTQETSTEDDPPYTTMYYFSTTSSSTTQPSTDPILTTSSLSTTSQVTTTIPSSEETTRPNDEIDKSSCRDNHDQCHNWASRGFCHVPQHYGHGYNRQYQYNPHPSYLNNPHYIYSPPSYHPPSWWAHHQRVYPRSQWAVDHGQSWVFMTHNCRKSCRLCFNK